MTTACRPPARPAPLADRTALISRSIGESLFRIALTQDLLDELRGRRRPWLP